MRVCYRKRVRAKAPLHAARRAAVSILVAVAAIALPALPAGAHEGGGLIPVPRPPAPPGDGAKAEQLIKEIEARAASDPRTGAVVAAPIAAAKKSIERGHGALAASDPDHARMLFRLALSWAETARDLERAAAAEQVAATTAKSANDAATKVERARALLEETQARRGRAAAELAKLEGEAKEASRRAADAEQRRLDAGKKGGKGAGGKTGGEAKKPDSAPGGDGAARPQAARKGAP
jgi:hypothetical protein